MDWKDILDSDSWYSFVSVVGDQVRKCSPTYCTLVPGTVFSTFFDEYLVKRRIQYLISPMRYLFLTQPLITFGFRQLDLNNKH